MKLSYSPYELVPRSRAANAVGVREGALLQVETEHGLGYADLHPWTEFGDLPLRDQLKTLADGQLTSLAKRSLAFAKIDAGLRANKTSAFTGLQIPRSHFLLPGPLAAGPDLLLNLVEDGYQVVKIKCGRNPSVELQQFMHLAHHWPSELKLRLDFNATLAFSSVDDYLTKIPRRLRSQIEFIEDPCSFSAESWGKLKDKHALELALDLEAINPIRVKQAVDASCVNYFVLKPAVQDPEQIWQAAGASFEGSQVKFVMTSYLDHPLGQASAAWASAVFNQAHPGRLSDCGLLSHFVYEPSEFSDQIGVDGPYFLNVDGTGFGFDLLLKAQSWQVLK